MNTAPIVEKVEIHLGNLSMTQKSVWKLQTSCLHIRVDKYLRQSIDMGMYGAVMSATNMYIKSGGTDWHVPYEILDIKHLWRLRVRWLPMHQQIKIHLINVSYWLYYKMVKTGYD